jgi:hypothetical protein
MSKVAIQGDPSGSGTFTIAAPNSNNNRTLNLPDNSGTVLTSASNLAGVTGVGKVLQVVRATDTTQRTSTSATFADSGLSVTITPTSASSNIILISTSRVVAAGSVSGYTMGQLRLVDSANATISGAQGFDFGTRDYTTSGSIEFQAPVTLVGYASPGVTTAVTYKLQFAAVLSGITFRLNNQFATGQLFAIEVAA